MARLVITKDNTAPLIEILTGFCLVVSVLSVITRLATKHYTLHRFDLDDHSIFISLVFASAQSTAIWIAASNGLGQRLDSLSSSQVSTLLKAQYASTFLFIASVYFAKLSLLVYLRGLSPSKKDRTLGLVTGWVVTLWAAIAVLTTAFQCHLPQTWDYINNACFDRTSWANFVAIVNGLTDIALIILPSMIILRLKVAPSKKAVLLAFFMARLSVIAAIIVQVVYINRTSLTPDPIHSTWPVTICIQIVQCLSILISCVVYLRPFLDSLQTGFIQVADLRRQQLPGFGYDPDRQDRKEGSRQTKSAVWSIRNPWSGRSKTESQRSMDIELQRNRRAGLQGVGNEVKAGPGRPNDEDVVGDEGADAHSRSRIVMTTTLTVREEDSSDGR